MTYLVIFAFISGQWPNSSLNTTRVYNYYVILQAIFETADNLELGLCLANKITWKLAIEHIEHNLKWGQLKPKFRGTQYVLVLKIVANNKNSCVSKLNKQH